jgi:hypothetical protein
MYVWKCTWLAPEWSGEFCSYSAFKSLSIIDQRLVNMNVTAPKNFGPSDEPQKQNGYFLERGSNSFD